MPRYQSAPALDKIQPSQSPSNRKENSNKTPSIGTKIIPRGEATLINSTSISRDGRDGNLANSRPALDDFDLDQWLKDFIRYAIFLVFFTLLIFQGRGSDQIAAYVAMWKTLIENRTLEIRSADLDRLVYMR